MADSAVGLHFDAVLGVSAASHSPAETPVAHSAEEERLIAALREGAEDAYETLIDMYQQPVYNLICRLLGETGEAADIVQEVFLKIFRNIRSFRAASSLKTWIYRIAVNEAYNHRRWFSRHQRPGVTPISDEGGQACDTCPDQSRSPFDLASDHEIRSQIEMALEQLNPNFRAAVVLRDVEDLSYEEIAAVLGVSLGTVKSRIVRGREALRLILADRFEPQPALRLSAQNG